MFVDSSFFANQSNAGLNSAAFLSKDSSSYGAVGTGRQSNVGFAGFADAPMMELNEFGSQSTRRDGSAGDDRQTYGYGGGGVGGGSAPPAEYMSREQQPLYISRSSGSRYDDSGPPMPPARDYASSVIKGNF